MTEYVYKKGHGWVPAEPLRTLQMKDGTCVEVHDRVPEHGELFDAAQDSSSFNEEWYRWLSGQILNSFNLNLANYKDKPQYAFRVIVPVKT